MMEDKNDLLELPTGWVWTILEEVCDYKKGKKPKSSIQEYKEGYHPYILVERLRGKEPELFTNDKNCPICSKENVLMVWDGSIGISAIGIEGAIGSTIVALTPFEIVPKYLKYFIQFNQPIIQSKSRGTALQHVNPELFWNLPFPLAPLPEQHRIVAKIEELFTKLDAGVEALSKVKAQLKRYRQAVLKSALGKYTSDFRNNDSLTNWKSCSLKELVQDKDGLKRGPFGSAIKKAFFVPKGYKVYEQGNAINDDPYRGRYYINEKKYKELESFKVEPGDLIVSCSGVTLGRITEIPPDAEPGIINQALLRIRLNRKIISSKFFITYFRTSFFQKQIFEQSQGTAMPNLVGLKQFKEIRINVPPLKEQFQILSEIESRLSEADNFEKTIDAALAKADALRQSTLKQAFKGKLVLQDPSDEPAEKLLGRIKTEKAKLGAERKEKRRPKRKSTREKKRRHK